jgi:hypothetical protein
MFSTGSTTRRVRVSTGSTTPGGLDGLDRPDGLDQPRLR